MKYCPYCKRQVEPIKKKKFNWVFFLLTCWFGIGIVYLIWYLLKFSKKHCPICNAKL